MMLYTLVLNLTLLISRSGMETARLYDPLMSRGNLLQGPQFFIGWNRLKMLPLLSVMCA